MLCIDRNCSGDGQIMSSDGNVFPRVVVIVFVESKTKYNCDV